MPFTFSSYLVCSRLLLEQGTAFSDSANASLRTNPKCFEKVNPRALLNQSNTPSSFLPFLTHAQRAFGLSINEKTYR